jgi:hypothetical protein
LVEVLKGVTTICGAVRSVGRAGSRWGVAEHHDGNLLLDRADSTAASNSGYDAGSRLG